MVPDAEFTSYYGRPVLKPPTWSATDIAGYLFLGGLAGGSSVLAAGAELTGRPRLASATKITALGAITGSLVALVHDLGRPERFVNMLRVIKPTSPMSIGSWLLALYGPQAGLAAATTVTGLFPRLGRAATVGAATLGPAVASYTSVLVADTAVPAWHEGRRQLPFVFVASAAAAAGGAALITVPVAEAGPARRVAVVGAVGETVTIEVMLRRIGLAAEAYRGGRAKLLLDLARGCSVIGCTAALLGRRSRTAAVAAGALLLAGSALTRFGVFAAGVTSASDPRYTVVPQRERIDRS